MRGSKLFEIKVTYLDSIGFRCSTSLMVFPLLIPPSSGVSCKGLMLIQLAAGLIESAQQLVPLFCLYSLPFIIRFF